MIQSPSALRRGSESARFASGAPTLDRPDDMVTTRGAIGIHARAGERPGAGRHCETATNEHCGLLRDSGYVWRDSNAGGHDQVPKTPALFSPRTHPDDFVELVEDSRWHAAVSKSLIAYCVNGLRTGCGSYFEPSPGEATPKAKTEPLMIETAGASAFTHSNTSAGTPPRTRIGRCCQRDKGIDP